MVVAITRRTFLFTAALAACATPNNPEPRTVLFVCLHGSVRSPIAREMLRRRAAERGVAVRVLSRGLQPEDGVSPRLADALAAEGIDTKRDPLFGLAATDLQAADIVVIFDPLPAGSTARDVRDWSDVPSMNADYPKARAVLAPKIEALVYELAARR